MYVRTMPYLLTQREGIVYMKRWVYIYIEIRFSCAYWLLSVICLLDSHLSKCCVSHRQQISRLSNRMIAPITCHQENSSITTLRASFPTMSLFFLTFHLLLVDSCSTASQAMLGAKVLVLVCGVIAWCGPNLLYLNSNLLSQVLSPYHLKIPLSHSICGLLAPSSEYCGPFIYGSTALHPWVSFWQLCRIRIYSVSNNSSPTSIVQSSP